MRAVVSLRAVMGVRVRSEPVPALWGRQRERQALDSLREDLRSGRGWALVVRGEAGVGKSVQMPPRGGLSTIPARRSALRASGGW